MKAYLFRLRAYRKLGVRGLHKASSSFHAFYEQAWVGRVLLTFTILICLKWSRTTPYPGYAIAFIAFIAAAISVRKGTPFQTFIWLFAIGVLLHIEFKAIRFDREGNARDQQDRFNDQQSRFKDVADRIDASISANEKNFGHAARTANKVLTSAEDAVNTIGTALDEITGRNTYPYIIPDVRQQTASLIISASGPDMLTGVVVSVSHFVPEATNDNAPVLFEQVGNLHRHMLHLLKFPLKLESTQNDGFDEYLISINTQKYVYTEWLTFKPDMDAKGWKASYSVNREEYDDKDHFSPWHGSPQLKANHVSMPVCRSADLKEGLGLDGKQLVIPICGEH